MRSFLAGLALFLAFLTGTTALAAYVAYDVLLDPSRAGQVLDEAMEQPELQQKILTKAVPGYAQLPPGHAQPSTRPRAARRRRGPWAPSRSTRTAP